MSKILLSVVLATFNEELNLDRCLLAVKNIADEIVIVDGSSTDKTVEIAKKFGANVLVTQNHPIFHINKKKAIDMARGDWILQLDADEVVTTDLASEIMSKIKNPNPGTNGYWLPRSNYFLDRFLTKGGQYPDYTLRLYRRGQGNLPAANVHEQAVVAGKTEHMTHDLQHYGDVDFEKYLTRLNRYTDLMALELKDRPVPMTAISAFRYLVLKPCAEFFSIYVRHLGLVDGFPGFVFAFFSGLRFSMAYIKYWQTSKAII